jgi:hypothetical protein
MNEINYLILPEHMQDAMRRYVEHGIRPGSFLYLILCNDFVHALGHADPINMARIVSFAGFLYLEASQGCWGSREKVDAWIKARELEREEKRKQEMEEKEAVAKEGRIIDGAISRADDEEYGGGGIPPAKGE